MKEGKYIIFESGEGGGKTIHAKFCKNYLISKKIKAIYSREPGGVEVAERIREIVLDKKITIDPLTELYLFEAARTEFFKEIIIPNRNNGTSIISDRSMYSSEAYQGYAGGIDLNLIKLLNEESSFGIKPDLVILINVLAEKGLEKELDKDRFGEKGIDFHKKVNEGYLKIAKENPDFFLVIPYIENGLEEMKNLYLPRINKLFEID